MLLLAMCVAGVGRGNMEDQWPWEAKELDPQKPPSGTERLHLKEGTWLLKISIIGENCLAWWAGKFNNPVGSLTCLGQRFYNATAQETQWWGSPNHSEPNPHPLSSFYHLQQAWNKVDTNIKGGPHEDCAGCVEGPPIPGCPGTGRGLCIRGNTSLLFPPPLTSR
jgi:hypothetical protein